MALKKKMFNVSLIAEIKYSPKDSVYKKNFQTCLQIDYLSTYFTRNLSIMHLITVQI